MSTIPHVPIPDFDRNVVIVFAAVLGSVVALAVALVTPRLKIRIPYAPLIAGGLLAFTTYTVAIQTRATDRLFNGYFSSKTPEQRLQDHFADFEEKVLKIPEIKEAVGEFPDGSAMLQLMAKRGLPRLDDATLRHRSELMAILLSRVGDRTCASLQGWAPATEADQQDIWRAMVKLESKFAAEWMQVLLKQMLAEARKAPIPEISDETGLTAYRTFQTKVGAATAARVSAGLQDGASDSEHCWAVRKIYDVAPTLPEPHATILLRLMVDNE